MRYTGSSTTFRDSIINPYGDFNFKSGYNIVRFRHYLDVHWNLSSKIKFSNSIGFGIEALVKANTSLVAYDASMIQTYPMLKCTYQPQITEEYKRFSIGYYVNVDVFALPLFSNANTEFAEADERKIPLNNVRFNTVGIRIIPKIKRVELPEPID